LGALLFRVAGVAAHRPSEGKWPRGNMDRAAVLDHLENTPGKHLIIVDYLPIHNEDSEWVYNEANIDASPVVWARDMGEKDNQELLRYFHDREAWTIVVSDTFTTDLVTLSCKRINKLN